MIPLSKVIFLLQIQLYKKFIYAKTNKYIYSNRITEKHQEIILIYCNNISSDTATYILSHWQKEL